MGESAPQIVSPEVLEAVLQEETDVGIKVRQLSEALILVLHQIGNEADIAKIRNIMVSLVNQEEIYQKLYLMYEEIFTIWQRLRAMVTKSNLGSEDKQRIQARAAQIIGTAIFNLQREVFFKIVNAKEVAEGEKSEDGPALLFPGIEKIKNSILRHIQAQTQQLRPTAVEICKTFQGVSDRYVETEDFKPGEKRSYDTIAQVYDLEKSLYEEVGRDISLAKIDETDYLKGIVERFEKLQKMYRLKIKSLQDKRAENVLHFEKKIEILKDGCELADKRMKPLKVLVNLVQRFPGMAKQLDFFAESHYQAKAVIRFLEEVNEEMSQVFKLYTLESFSVVGCLRYKLNGTSHMYESIYYYYAVVQIESDIKEALARRYADSPEHDREAFVAKELEAKGITAIVLQLHQFIAEMNEANAEIHNGFLEYKIIPDLEKLRQLLATQTERINALHLNVKSVYKSARKLFLDFLSEDLGSTDLISQFNNFLKIAKQLPEATDIRKSFTKLLATKRNELEFIEKKLTEQFGSRLDAQKISAMAQLKIRKDYQKELLREIQEFDRVQDTFLHVLKEFIKTQDEQDSSHESDNTVIFLVQRNFEAELAQFRAQEAMTFKKILHTPNLSDRDIAVCFLAANITPQEIESFSRLLPALPRNEFQLDSPYGRILLDIKTMHKERLQSKGGSAAHITERIYEKRERIKLINTICLFFKTCADPYYKKIDTEESKINHLITLQRRKYQKELNEVIRYWQYLVQEQISPGQGARGSFRNYGPEDKQLMARYISPEQLNTIERQLEASYDLVADSKLFDVESFLMEIAHGLFQNFKKDLRIKAQFENFEKGKKIKQAQFQNEEYQNILESDNFMPNVRKCMAKVVKVARRKTIAQFLDYWEFLIDREVPASEKRKKKKVPKTLINTDSDNAVHYIGAEQLNQVRHDLELIQMIRDPAIQNRLIKSGLPVLTIVQQCFNLFKDGQKKLVMKEVDKHRQEKMKLICNNVTFEKTVAHLIEAAQSKFISKPSPAEPELG